MALPVATILNQAVWAILPYAARDDRAAITACSSVVHAAVLPAYERSVAMDAALQELRKLPFETSFPVTPFGPEALRRVLDALRQLRMLRRRELVGHGAGFAPTELEPWSFEDWDSLRAAASAAALATRSAKLGAKPSLLLGAVLRRAANQPSDGSLVTSSVGLEWIDGPASEPLQLGLHIVISSAGKAKIAMEVGSGGWSPWAENWTLEDKTLEANLAVAFALPNEGHALVSRAFPAAVGASPPRDGSAEIGEDGDEGCHAYGISALRCALETAGGDGVRSIICIGGLAWRKAPPPWCPPDVRKVSTCLP